MVAYSYISKRPVVTENVASIFCIHLCQQDNEIKVGIQSLCATYNIPLGLHKPNTGKVTKGKSRLVDTEDLKVQSHTQSLDFRAKNKMHT